VRVRDLIRSAKGTMAMVTDLKKGGKTVCKTTKPVKKGIVIPAKKTKSTAVKSMKFETPKDLSPRMKHIHKMAQKYIIAQKKKSVTRRSKAVSIVKTKDGRKVYVKKMTNQKARSLVNPNEAPKTRCVRASRDRKAMMQVVNQYKVAHLNKLREARVKASKKKTAFTPIKIRKGASGLGKYNDKVEKKNIKLQGLPKDVTEHKIRLALGASSKDVTDVKIMPCKKDQNKKFAMLSTPNELAAKSVFASRVGKMRLGSMAITKPCAEKVTLTKEQKELAKKEKAELKAKKAAITKKNRANQLENKKAAKRCSTHRRSPKFAPTKVFRNRKTHQVYAVKKNPAAKAPTKGRSKMAGHNRMRAMVRLTRK